jgi:HEAT repeat protein
MAESSAFSSMSSSLMSRSNGSNGSSGSTRRGSRPTVGRLLLPLAMLVSTLGPGLVTTSLAQATAERDNRVRIVELLQLGRSHAPNARAQLEHALNDPAESVRIAAVSGLVALGDTSAVPAIERRLSVETAPSVRSRLESAVSQVRKSSLDQAKFVVQLGQMTNATPVQNNSLPDVLRSATKAHAAHLKGAVVVEGPGDALLQKAAEKHLPVLVLDGQVSKLARADAAGNVTLQAQVQFVVRKAPSQVLKGTFHGGAAGSDSPKALESKKRLAELQGEVVSGAVESALRGAESGLAEASR